MTDIKNEIFSATYGADFPAVKADVAIRLQTEIERLTAENEKLRAALVQVRGFVAVMSDANWKDIGLHIHHQCGTVDQQSTAETRK